MLGADQASLSGHYATKGQHQIIPEQFEIDGNGVPLLRDAQATFSCRTEALHRGGDHHIIVAEVLEFATSGSDPLVFYGGRYDRLGSSGEESGQ